MNFNTNNSIKLRPKIYLLPDNAQPDFEKTVLRSLRDLEKISVGRRLIEKIGKCSHRVYIASTEDDWTCAVVNQKKASIPGKGSISVILFPKTKTMTDRHYLTAKLKTAAKPSFVDFAHELIHAYYNACGKNALYLNRCDKLVWTDDEEYKTIMGFPSKNPLRKTPKITENAILAALGLPERFSHYGSCDGLYLARTELISKLYRRFCKKRLYEGQMNNPPPPIINCTLQDLGFSDKVVMLYKTISPPSISINTRIFYLDGIIAEPDEPVRKEIDIKDCLDIFQPENLFPESNVKVLSVSLYRLSAAESFSLDSP